MARSLRSQIVLLYLGMLSVGLGGLVVWAGVQLREAAVHQAHRELVARAVVVATALAEPLEHWATPSPSALAHYARSAGARLVVLDPTLRVVASSEPLPERLLSAPRQGLGWEGNARRLFATVPVVEEHGRVVGAVELSVPASAVFDTVRGTWFTLGSAGLGILCAVAAASVLLAHGITQPLQRLTSAVEAVASGKLQERVEVKGSAEVERLGHAFNRMAERVEAMVTRQRTFAAHAAHELRSPLAALRLRLEVLQQRLPSDPALAAHVMQALRNVDRLQRLVDHLLVLAAVEERRGLRRERVDLAPLLYELADEIGPVVAEAGLRLDVEVPPHLPLVEADPEQILLAIRNLLDNAVKYTPPGGRVLLQAEAQMEGVVLRVRDTGVGIPPEHLPHVFDRFYRVPAPRRADGSGLGLALVKEVVEAYGGRVTIRSEVGAGTEVSFLLPAKTS